MKAVALRWYAPIIPHTERNSCAGTKDSALHLSADLSLSFDYNTQKMPTSRSSKRPVINTSDNASRMGQHTRKEST